MAEKKSFFDDFEEYDVSEDHRPSRGGAVIRVIFYSLIILVNCALIFRVCMAEDPKAVKSLKINDSLRTAYAESAEDFKIYTQSVYDMYTSDGVYYSTGLFICPAAGQLQVSVRYNVRTADNAMISAPDGDPITDFLYEGGFISCSPYSGEIVRRHIASVVTITEKEMREGDFFTFRLTDDRGNYYTPSDVEKLTRILYVYHKLTFDGLTDTDTDLYLEIYPIYKGVPDYTTVLGRMRVYSSERPCETYSLSGSERSKLS